MRSMRSSAPDMLAPRAGLSSLPLSLCSLLLVSSIAAGPALAQSVGAEPGPPAIVTVGPQDSQSDIQAAFDSMAPGQTLRMLPGRYVGLTLALETPGVTIAAEGAIMDGAAIEIAGGALTRTDNGMSYDGLPAPLDPLPSKAHANWAKREAPTPELQAREVLWVCEAQDVPRERCGPYTRKPAGEPLGPGEFAIEDQSLLLGDDGGAWDERVLLWPQTPQALSCTDAAAGVTIRGLTVRRYAPAFHYAQVNLRDCADVTLEHVAIIESSAIGLQSGNRLMAIGSRFNGNGQMGIVGWAPLMTFVDSTANRNNHRGFPGWNAGGVKVNAPGHDVPFKDPDQAITRLVWIGGEVAGNRGAGIWTDGSAWNPLVRGALIRDNTGNGVHIELTFGGLIEDNVLRGNGDDCSKDKAQGSAILIHGTVDAIVRRNLVVVSTDCGRGINLRQRNVGHWETARNEIVDNTIVQVSSVAYGTNGFWIVQSDDPSIEARVYDNLFDRNTYVLADGDGTMRWRYETWSPASGGLLSWERWQARGHDVNGRLLRVPDPASWAAAH